MVPVGAGRGFVVGEGGVSGVVEEKVMKEMRRWVDRQARRRDHVRDIGQHM